MIDERHLEYCKPSANPLLIKREAEQVEFPIPGISSRVTINSSLRDDSFFGAIGGKEFGLTMKTIFKSTNFP